MRCLISTIIRNRGAHLPTWSNQLIHLVKANPQIKFSLSVFENDSKDNTKQALKFIQKNFQSHFEHIKLSTLDLNWPYFGSIKGEDRVKYLAEARNKTLDQMDAICPLTSFDKVISVEPDVVYSPIDISKLLYSNLDIVSGYSTSRAGEGVPNWIYDTWATRLTLDDLEYMGPAISDLPDLLPVASTFNCFCVYNAQPFADGMRFSGINPRTNHWDCDTANICYSFANYGYPTAGMYKIPVIHNATKD